MTHPHRIKGSHLHRLKEFGVIPPERVIFQWRTTYENHLRRNINTRLTEKVTAGLTMVIFQTQINWMKRPDPRKQVRQETNTVTRLLTQTFDLLT